MIKRTYISCIISVLMAGAVFAQQKPLYSHYMFNKMAINPGCAGSSDMISMTGVHRQQWFGIDGAPTTQSFNVNTPINFLPFSSGLGFDFAYDKIGLNKDMYVKLAYALRISAGNGKLGIGIAGGIFNPTADYSKLVSPSELGNLAQDGNIPTGKLEGVIKADIDFGLFYKTEDVYFGLSSAGITAPTVPWSRESATGETQRVRHYYLNSGYNLQLTNPTYVVKPSFLIQTDAKTTSFDANVMLEYNKKVWGGVSYRLSAANPIIVLFGLEMGNGVKIGFAYDVPSIKTYEYLNKSFEIMMGYDFSLKVDKLPQRYKSIRYL